MHSFLPMGGKVLAAARNRYSLEWGSRTGVRLKKRAILRAWEVSVKHSNFRLTSPPNKRSPTLSLVGQMKGSSKLCSSCWWPNPYTIYIYYIFSILYKSSILRKKPLRLLEIYRQVVLSTWHVSPRILRWWPPRHGNAVAVAFPRVAPWQPAVLMRRCKLIHVDSPKKDIILIWYM